MTDPLEDAIAPHQYEDKPMPRWQKVVGIIFVVVWAGIIIAWHGRLSADVWPPDRSFVAPNLLASFVLFSLGLIFAAVLWPPTRKRLHHFMDKKLAPVHAHLTHLREHHEASAARQEHMIRQNAHIIKHSAAPNEDHTGYSLVEYPAIPPAPNLNTGPNTSGLAVQHAAPVKKAAPKKAAAKKAPAKKATPSKETGK